MRRLVLVCLVVLLVLSMSATVSAGPKHPWKVPGDFATLQEAIDSPDVADGDTIMVGPGSFAGALLTKDVTIKGVGGAVIDDGPAHSSGLVQGFRIMAGGSGATLSHLTFMVDLAVMNGEAADDVTIDHCVFLNAIQAVSNWSGSGWAITHNDFVDLRTRNGGGIAVLVGDRFGGVVEGNSISHNKISGTLYVMPADGGGYNGSGIVLYADYRWGMAGAESITGNQVVKNKIAIASDTPEVVDIAAIELTDSRDDPTLDPVICGNAIGFNDLRGTELQMTLTPENLDECNDISRNMGDNRGHGAHPSLFGPGG